MALVTDSLSRYRFDPFFRTEANIIALQAAFALVILGLVGTSFSVLYQDISQAIVSGTQDAVASGNTAKLVPSIIEEIQQIRTQNLVAIISLIVATTILFGYIIARITLAPARNSLAAQKQFIGNIAHELRTPLSVIKTNIEVALLDDDITAELKQTLESNIDELDRISEIINNLLSLSALIRPERVEFAAVDLSEIATGIVEKYSQLAKRNEQNITIRKSPQSLVWGSATALEQVVGNLLKNAIMYTPRSGQITITIAPTATNHVEFIIQDTGIGIARKDLFRIFEPFYRSEQSRNRSQGGSGLGLAIVSELVKMHSGKIIIRSAVGRGTSVVVQLPSARRNISVGGQERQEGLNEIAVDFSANRT